MRQNLDSPFDETPGRLARHLGASLAALGLAAASLANPGMAEPLPSASIARMVQLPSGGLQAVETTDGELLFFSENGRYVLRGSAVDLWHGAKLTAFDQTQQLAGRIDLARLKLDVADLGAIDVGEGPEVVIFVDPFCPHCTAMYSDLAPLRATYRFRLVPIPVLGEPSQRAVLALACLSGSDPEQAREALLGGLTADLPEPAAGCGESVAQRTLIAAHILGIPGTPFLIAPDGRLRQGRPDDLAAWLAGVEERAE
jgi:thiol:disulfide interchange protein DsbC